MNIWGILVSLAIGALCGWLAGKIMNTKQTMLMNIILGVVGGFVFSLIAGLIGISASNIIGEVIFGTVGACLCIWGYGKLKK
ncbi:MAG: GlsB/YeaQ/YmgE family stress response membrane protein [Eubacteriales bacterium]|nr:GlsB/YeaQ/YmgE family stress response membrane protein [Eubacteriales bacterium]MDD4512957.1 GlsB/YeaQ/YmgE family stress response membrane protein [Eubacteriales bacterium]